jgi:S-DNA-T family DNA segregation ATPase FtsK/SpoIIIE
MAKTQEPQHFHVGLEVVGAAMAVTGLVLFFSLISYAPGDSWFAPARAARLGINYIGPFGATLAYLSYSLLGAAAYLLVAMMLGCGWTWIMAPRFRFASRWAGCAGVVLAGACLAHLLRWEIIGAARLLLPGEGGYLGKWIGAGVLQSVFGRAGSIAVLLIVYGCCLLLLTGVSPSTFLRTATKLLRRTVAWFSTWRFGAAPELLSPEALAARRAAARRAELGLAPAPERAGSRRRSGANGSAAGDSGAESPLLSLDPAAPPGAEDAPAEGGEPDSARPLPKIFDAAAVTPAPTPKDRRVRLAPLSSVPCDDYELPPLDLLEPIDLQGREAANPDELIAVQKIVVETLSEFGIAVTPGDITRGPTITRYEVYPASGVRVDRIVALERDIARATCAEQINILAPIPGRDTVGIEIANAKKQKVTLRELLESDDFASTKCKIPLALGKDVYGKTIIADLAAMPHGLVAGTTGSGKSVCINSIIASILYRFTPADLRFIMIDPKVVEMQIYNALPHLVVPVVTDPKKVLVALKWAVDEMEKRYAIFAKTGVRNIAGFNARPKPKTQAQLDAEKGQERLPLEEEAAAAVEEPAVAEASGEETNPENLTSEERITNMGKVRNSRETDLIVPDHMPYIVIIVDELADLMQTAPADVEGAIARITQKARAAGIHMIIATQTPRADVITGVIKANVPCRVAFQVASALDSRVILDENGAERLLGQGDMMYRPPGTSRMVRAQGVLVTDEEIQRVVKFAGMQGEPSYETSIHEQLSQLDISEEDVSEEDEEQVVKCIEVMKQEGKASTSLFQRRLRLGYTRAARILDILEMRGYVGPGDGAKPREILVNLETI